MKRILIMAITALMSVTTINAQEGYEDTQHEVALSYGVLSTSQWLNVFEHIASAVFENGKYENERNFGPIGVEYFYHAKKWIGVGGTFVYGSCTQDIVNRSDPDNVKKDGEMVHNFFTLMPAVKFDWLRKKHFGMYSKLAFGATLRQESVTSYNLEKNPSSNDVMVHVNWQVSPIGMEFGGVYLRGFAELGIGEQGTLLAGLRYKF